MIVLFPERRRAASGVVKLRGVRHHNLKNIDVELSTHTAMLDSLGFRNLTSKAILAHTIGGVVAAFVAHWSFILYSLI